jgi:hypothetical protein
MPDDYEVGYKRPPKATQFRKGQAGNPRGRPKGARNLRTDLAEELAERISITVQGSRRRITKQRALIKSLYAKAMKGDTRAMALLINIALRLLEPEADQAPVDLSPDDAKIIVDFLQKHRGKNAGDSS